MPAQSPTKTRLKEKLTYALSRFRRFPRSLTGQILIILALGVTAAQLVSSTIWLKQLAADAEQNVREVAQPMAFRVAATISYFSSLPQNYRHIVIDQLQEMGGTRFFVTVNNEEITMPPEVVGGIGSLDVTEEVTIDDDL